MFDQKKIKNLVNSYPLIQITGGLVHVQEIIIQELTDKLQQNTKFEIDFLVVVKKWSSDIARFIESAEIMDKEITYAGLDLTLEQMGFEFVPKVEQKGQYSRLGDTISIWPIGYKNPIKVEFFDEKIESIYFFDELYGRKLDAIDRFFLSKINILDDKVEWENIAIFPSNEISSRKKLTGKKFHFINGDNKVQLVELYDRLSIKQDFLLIVFDNENLPESIKLSLNLSYPQLFYSRLDIAQQEMERLVSEGYQVFLQTEHLEQIPKFFKNYLLKDGAYDLQAGFVNKATKEILLTDRELFGTIYITKEKQKRLSSKQAQKLLSQIEGEVEIGDYVVHEDHGIAVYAGITREKDQEYLHLKYADNDELLIPLNQIHKITKYIGVSNELPKIGKLDKVSWRKTTEKTKKIINILAKDLVEHYAKVQLASAFPIQSIDSDSYHQFNSAFQFEETPDQKRTINEVLSDLSRERPMNRLIVGDVGFGKTEVAMRACFKIIENGKQVAVLVPTTVLAAQHYKVFSDRFRKFNTKIAMMSRFSGKEENSKIAQELANGKIDIVIGTHRLLSTDVKFKNLGLLVIDEEQKFGVRQKEKLKKLKYGVHVLSMTATPIPRTLSMALSEIQDISIISTPPEGRKSIDTKVERFSWNKIREVIKHEIDRNGQVYFVHNRVQTIDSIKAQLEKLLPGVRFALGHGQMHENQLEKVMNDFYERKFDCLVCTTIIENGLDMPNVNTIIINKAQNFGLGQLYQLRGRVGRSERQAYAYLFYEGKSIDEYEKSAEENISGPDEIIDEEEEKKVNRKYIERLKAIMESQELGAGFKIASRDLEIRGAGNLLGREQHGQITKVGLALYMQMLAEEIEKLKLAENLNMD